MQRTSNYQFPQWEKEDRILMEDFNGAMANIENAIDGAKSDASSGIAEAKSQASTAQAAADAAKQTALTFKHFEVGQYTGTENVHDIILGYKPSAVTIWPCVYPEHPSYGAKEPMTFVPVDDGYTSRKVTFIDDGFRLEAEGSGDPVDVNHSRKKYFYIALR